jgi:NitT/TauT family transport system permease protein
MKRSKEDYILPIITFVSIIIIWELIIKIFKIKEIIFPSPLNILNTFLTKGNILLSNAGVTILEAVLGFIIGSVIAFSIAVLFIYSRKAKKALYPYTVALKTAPLYALAPLLVLWFGSGLGSKIAMAALVAFFPVLVNTVKGLSSIDEGKLELFKSLKASKFQTFIKLKIPNALPHIFSGLKIATTFSVVGATIAEFTGASKGIGYLIIQSSYLLDTSLMFSAIITISIFGIIFFFLLEKIEKRVVFWDSEK